MNGQSFLRRLGPTRGCRNNDDDDDDDDDDDVFFLKILSVLLSPQVHTGPIPLQQI